MRHFRILFFLFFSLTAIGQSIPLSESTKVSVITCGPSPEIFALFGHTAIRIQDKTKGLDLVYNYGAFDFSTPNFALRFVKGDMQYFATCSTFDDFVMQYVYEKRSVSEQVLDIPREKKQQLFEELNAVLQSDARFYTYKFIDRNCTNMASDVINKVLGGKIIYKRENTDTTYRSILFPYFKGHFWEQWGTSVLFGTKVDERATTLFLPTELETSLNKTTFNGKPIVSETKLLLDYPTREAPFSWWNNIYIYLVFLASVVLVNKKGLTLFYLILIGGLGLFFSFNGLYSLHEELACDYNVLLFNPALLPLALFYARNDLKWMKYTTFFCIACMIIYLIAMIGKAHFWIVLPMMVVHSIVFLRLLRKSE